MRVVIYARQSLDKDHNELGLERQLSECHRLCDARGYEVVQVIQENNTSATSGHRPGYERLLKLIDAREVDVVVVLRVDRLLRRVVDLEALIQLSERTGVQIATVQGDIDLSSSSGRLIGRILASVARGEMETKSERHVLANAQKARAGLPHGSRRPYGYQADLMHLEQPEAVVLREMARRVIAGHGYREVAYWANEHGHRTTTGKLWYGITVRNMLGKPRYAGIREYKGAQYPAQWQAVFDAETWEQLQLTMRLRREAGGAADTPVPRKYLLTGLAYCGNCGNALNGSIKRDRADTPLRRIYHCRTAGDAERRRGCGKVRRNADALEDFILDLVVYRLETPELTKLLRSKNPDDDRLRTLLGERLARKQRLDALVDDYATNVLNREQFARAKARTEADLQLIDAELEQLNHGRAARGLLPVGVSIRQAWERSESNDWRRALMGLFIEKIIVSPGIAKPLYKQWRFDIRLIRVVWRV